MPNTINIIKLDDKNKMMWDKYIQNHPLHSPYHLYAWLQAVSHAYQHNICYLVAMDNEQVVGVLPLAIIKPPLFKSSICSLPFCDLGGCLANTEEIKQKLEKSALVIQQKFNAKIIEYREQSTLALMQETQLTNQKVRMLLTLPETSDQLMASFKSKLRSQIRKAEKNGLTYQTGRNSEFIDKFYQVLSENMRRLGSPVHSKKWFEKVCQNYQEQCVIAIVYHQDVVTAAGLILLTDDKVSIPWASTRSEYNHLSPNMLLYWALLKYSTDHGCKEFDFGRSTYNEGTYKFKKQWGAQPELLNWKKYNNAGHLISESTGEVSKLRSLVEQTWRKLPLSLTILIGPKIRKYISL